MQDNLLRAEEVAELLNVRPSTVLGWSRENFIPSVHLGRCVRFDRGAVLKWVDEKRKAGRTTRIPSRFA